VFEPAAEIGEGKKSAVDPVEMKQIGVDVADAAGDGGRKPGVGPVGHIAAGIESEREGIEQGKMALEAPVKGRVDDRGVGIVARFRLHQHVRVHTHAAEDEVKPSRGAGGPAIAVKCVDDQDFHDEYPLRWRRSWRKKDVLGESNWFDIWFDAWSDEGHEIRCNQTSGRF
jgi:hypothetical protein